MKLLSSDDWLSSILKRKSYLLEEKNIIKFFKKNKLGKNQFVSTKIKNIKLSKILKKNRFRFITTNFQCIKKFSKVKEKDLNCFFAKKRDLNELKKISRNSYKFSRFHLDNKISTSISNRIFSSWIENYFKNKRGDYLLVYKKDKKVLGFLLLKKERKHFLRIDLIAVHNQHKKKNIGKKLINHAMFMYNKKFSHFIVGYQSHNNAAKKFYSCLGFRLKIQKDIYHFNS
tara:strand:+ start:3061 stop:3747 length:687 start_codon:yes stop_codon:yes gene_type:complete